MQASAICRNHTDIFNLSTQGEDDIDPVAETIDGLETELDESSDQAERNRLRSQLVSLYLVQDTMEAALSTLKDMEMPERAPIVAATYMELDSFTQATQWLDSLDLETAVDSNWKETFSILLDAAKEGRGLDSLSTSELADLEAIVDTPEVGKYESVTAQAVLAFVNGATYYYKAQEEPTGEGKRGTQEPEVLANEETVGQPLLGTPIPNPAASSVQLSCELPEGVEGILRLVDVQGRVWGETVVAEGKHLLELDLAQIPRGIVFCTLLMKDWPSQSKIVVIQ